MTKANLMERLNFEGKNVYLDGEVIFSGLGAPFDDKINIIGVTPEGTALYIGCGSCCEGPISILTESEKENFELNSVKLPSFNVYDILPVVFKKTYEGILDGEECGLLATGYGCHGQGIKLIGRQCSGYLEVVPSQEFREIKNTTRFTAPRLTVHQQNRTISLDVYMIFDRLKPGRTRTPGVPEFLIDHNYETYVSQEIHASKDLTSRLVELGVDIDKTIEENEGYIRIRRSR